MGDGVRGDEVATTIERLRTIWSSVLEVPEVRDADDFFELGGDSLMAFDVSSLAVEAGLEMPGSGVLQRPVLEELAAAVDDPDLFEPEGNW